MSECWYNVLLNETLLCISRLNYVPSPPNHQTEVFLMLLSKLCIRELEKQPVNSPHNTIFIYAWWAKSFIMYFTLYRDIFTETRCLCNPPPQNLPLLIEILHDGEDFCLLPGPEYGLQVGLQDGPVLFDLLKGQGSVWEAGGNGGTMFTLTWNHLVGTP